MFFMTAGVLYIGAAFGFYTYLLGTAQILPEEMVEATTPTRDESPAPQRQAA